MRDRGTARRERPDAGVGQQKLTDATVPAAEIDAVRVSRPGGERMVHINQAGKAGGMVAVVQRTVPLGCSGRSLLPGRVFLAEQDRCTRCRV